MQLDDIGMLNLDVKQVVNRMPKGHKNGHKEGSQGVLRGCYRDTIKIQMNTNMMQLGHDLDAMRMQSICCKDTTKIL